MTQKYNFMSNQEELSDKEINSYKDFDGLLAKHHQTSKQWKIKAIVYSSILVAIVACLSYWYVQKEALSGQQNDAQKAVIVEPANTPDTFIAVEKKENLVQGNRTEEILPQNNIGLKPKSTVEKQNSTIDTKPAVAEVKSTVQSGFEEAQPTGGYPALFDFFKQHVQYPDQSRKQKIEGSVLVEFYVNEKGKPTDIAVLKGINTELDKEALRLIQLMPKWQPALVEGKPVSMKVTIPLTFQIHSN